MSQQSDLKKILRTINNIYEQCKNSTEAKVDKLKVENTWITDSVTNVKKLNQRKISLYITLTGVKNER